MSYLSPNKLQRTAKARRAYREIYQSTSITKSASWGLAIDALWFIPRLFQSEECGGSVM